MKFTKTFSIALLPILLLGFFRTVYGAEERAPVSKNPPLVEAIQREDVRGTHRLIKKGANVNTGDPQGRTPLMHAARVPTFHTSMTITQLHKHGASLDTQDKQGFSALAHAVAANNPLAVRTLLSKGASTNLPASLEIPERIEKILSQHSAKRKQPRVLTDPITSEEITSLDPSKLITVGKNTYKKETMLNHILTQIASKTLEKIKDPVSQVPIGREKITSLAAHFGIPISEFENPPSLESLPTLEQYTAEQYILDSDASEDEDDTPVSRPAPTFVESRKTVFEEIRSPEEHPVEGFLEQLARKDALSDFRDMIKNNTLKALAYRLQKKNAELLDKSLSDSDYKQTQSEIKILEHTIKDRVATFERQKALRSKAPQETFFVLDTEQK